LRTLYRGAARNQSFGPRGFATTSRVIRPRPLGAFLPAVGFSEQFAMDGHHEDNTAWDRVAPDRANSYSRRVLRARFPGRPRTRPGGNYYRQGKRLFGRLETNNSHRPRTSCSTSCSASTCKMFMSDWRTQPHRAQRPITRWLRGRFTASRRVFCRKVDEADHFGMAHTQGTNFHRERAGTMTLVTEGVLREGSSASTVST